MPPAKKYNVKLRLPPSFLETLPVFAAPAPKPRSRAKKLSAEDKKNATSPRSSPAPVEEPLVSKINTGPKELSTAGLTLNTVTQVLDKSGRPCRKWKKGSLEFKTFSGFKVKVEGWRAQGERQSVVGEKMGSKSETAEISAKQEVTA